MRKEQVAPSAIRHWWLYILYMINTGIYMESLAKFPYAQSA
jgi:hypothetical protein